MDWKPPTGLSAFELLQHRGAAPAAVPPAAIAKRTRRFSGPIRVGFALPVLLAAGVERWLCALLAGLEAYRDRVEPFGVAHCGDSHAPDLATSREVLERCHLLTALRWQGVDRRIVPCGGIRPAIEILAANCEVLVVWSLHGLDWLSNWPGIVVGVSHGCGDWWMREAASWVDEWVAVAQVAAAPIPGSRAKVIYNGVDARRLSRTEQRDQVRAELGASRGDVLAVTLARYSAEKRHEIAIEALARLPRRYRLALVGYGPEESRLRDLAHRCGVSERIAWGRRDDVGNVLGAADVALCLSEAEGFGLTNVEALLAGVPLVSTGVGIVPELPQLCGFQPARIVIAEPAAVAAGLVDAVEAGRMGGDRRRLLSLAIRDNFTAPVMARRWVEYFERLLNHSVTSLG